MKRICVVLQKSPMKAVRILKELLHHLPYSAVGVAASLGLVLAAEKMGWVRGVGGNSTGENVVVWGAEEWLHGMHGLHLFLGCVVSSAIFWKVERGWFRLVLVGFVIPILICTLSDMVVPYFGSRLLGGNPVWHLALVQEPLIVFAPAIFGVVLGVLLVNVVMKLTEITHLLHVLVSSLASLFYIVSFSYSFWSAHTLLVFGITIVAVWGPCCFSDIVLPLAFTKGRGIPCCGHHPHDY